MIPLTSTAVDPVCGMTVSTTAPAGGSHAHAGTTYHFCAESCRRKFAADPAKYLAGRREAMTAAPGTKYVCPMDPGVESDRPGPCPVCGMALEPATPTADDGPDPELRDMTRRLVVGVAAGVPLLVLAMADMVLPGRPLAAAVGDLPLLLAQAALAAPVVFWSGWPLLVRGARSVVTLRPNMFTLIGLGVVSAVGYSLAVVADALTEPGHHGAMPEAYFETAAWVVNLVLVGQVLELRARHRTGEAVRQLLRLAPATARVVLPDGRETDLPLELVAVGDVVRVRPGERVPVDGVVREGATTADESMLTGEPMPVLKEAGARVMAGTINGVGSVTVAATGVGAGTVLARVVALVAQAQRSRLPVQATVDAVSAWFVPVVVVVALLTFAAWSWYGPADRWLVTALTCSVGVLVIACPCALGLATPMAVVVGVGRAARQGVLFRDAAALERLQAVDTVVFDKTGTLTEGKPRVMAVEAVDGFTADRVLTLAAAVERGSEHPLGAAVVAEADARGLAALAATDVQTTPGRGIAGLVEGERVAVGSAAFVGGTGDGIHVTVGGRQVGLVLVADAVRATSAEAVAALRAEGVRVVLLTGDARATAEAVAKELGIAEVIAETLPAEKFAVVQRLKAEGRVVAMTGDGINDAPALAAADVGVALGTGTDVAISTAGVTLVRPDVRGVVAARRLSRATVRTIRGNLVLAFAYNVLAIPVAAGALVPLGGPVLSPVWAAAAMSLSSVSVILNSLRLTRA